MNRLWEIRRKEVSRNFRGFRLTPPVCGPCRGWKYPRASHSALWLAPVPLYWTGQNPPTIPGHRRRD